MLWLNGVVYCDAGDDHLTGKMGMPGSYSLYEHDDYGMAG